MGQWFTVDLRACQGNLPALLWVCGAADEAIPALQVLDFTHRLGAGYHCLGVGDLAPALLAAAGGPNMGAKTPWCGWYLSLEEEMPCGACPVSQLGSTMWDLEPPLPSSHSTVTKTVPGSARTPASSLGDTFIFTPIRLFC